MRGGKQIIGLSFFSWNMNFLSQKYLSTCQPHCCSSTNSTTLCVVLLLKKLLLHNTPISTFFSDNSSQAPSDGTWISKRRLLTCNHTLMESKFFLCVSTQFNHRQQFNLDLFFLTTKSNSLVGFFSSFRSNDPLYHTDLRIRIVVPKRRSLTHINYWQVFRNVIRR